MKKRILIVDDDGQILKSLQKVLEGSGYNVVLAANGQEGLNKMETETIDLVLLDLNMPFKNGWDTFERMTCFNPFIPIIIITGRENQFDLASAAGVSSLMEKPLDVPLLLHNISILLAEKPEVHLKRLVG